MFDNYLDDKQTFLDNSVPKVAELGEVFVASVVLGEPAMEDAYEILTMDIMQGQVVTGTETEQLNALTVLVDSLNLNNLPGPTVYSTPASYMPALTAITGLILAGANVSFTGTGTANDPYVVAANVPSYANPTFSSIQGDPYDNTALAAALDDKQDDIATGSSGQFYAWDKTMRVVAFSQVGSKPTTLAGYGISQGDTLFNGKYIQASDAITGYSLGANRILAATDTWLQSLGILQRQISNREVYLGLPAGNGYALVSQTDGTRSWVPFGAVYIDAGTNVTITGTGTESDPYIINASGGGGGSPGGSNTEIQYNNSGAFGGVPDLVYTSGFITMNNPKIGTGGGNGHLHMRVASAVPSGIANFVTLFTQASPKTLGFIFGTDAFESYFQFSATADRTYTLPDASGTVALSNNTSFTNQTSVNVVHNKGYFPLVQVMNDVGEVFQPLSIVHDSNNDFTCTFSTTTSGIIISI